MPDLRAFPRVGGLLRHRASLWIALAVLLALPVAARAQFGAPDTTPVHDPAALKPPPGVKVAILEFDDMECPDCAAQNPVLKQAAAHYHIPWYRHDFPLPFHPWSFQAAVYARWFDTHSKQMGDDYRDYIFANQPRIETPAALVQWTQSFAKAHGLDLPFNVDPQGKLAAEVKADYALGQRIGIQHTPTIWIVTDGVHAAPYVEVVNPNQLYQIIDAAIAQTRGR